MKDLIEAKKVTRIDHLAETLRKDIHRRALREGDLYLTAAEAGQMLGVSHVMANRAMNVLADRRLVTRHRRRGTFVGPAFQLKNPTTALRVIHVIQGPSIKGDQQWSAVTSGCLQGLHVMLPGYQVQSNILSRHNPAEMVRQIFRQNTPEGLLAGVVLLSCLREVQELVQSAVREYQLPAVSYGTVYPNITEIPSVDQDQFELGRLQAKYLLDRGHRRIMLLMRDHWLPGDNLLFDGVNRALADAGMTYGVLGTRSVPEDIASIETEINHLLCLDNRPTGLICRSPLFAKSALEVTRSNSMRVPEDIDIIFDANDGSSSAIAGLPCAVAKYSFRKQFTLVAEIMEKLIAGKQLEKYRFVLPVVLMGPDSVSM